MDRKERLNFWLTLAGKGVSQAGNNFYSFAISFYILTVTGSAQSFALSLVLSTLPRILISPFAGNLVDRLNRKWIVVASDVLSGLLMLSLFLLTRKQSLSLTMIYSASVISSILLVFLNTAFSASYAVLVSKENLIKINSYQQMITAFLQFISPIIGGMIYAIIDIRLFLLINGISFLLSAFTELFIDFTYYSELKGKERQKQHFFREMAEGLQYLKAQRSFLAIMIYAFFINFFLGTYSVVMPYDLLTNLKLDSQRYGLVNACFPIGMMLMSTYVGRKKIVFSKNLFRNTMAMIGLIMFLFVIPVLRGVDLGRLVVPYYGLAMLLLSTTVMGVQIPLSVLAQTSIEEAYRGRVSGTLTVVGEGIVPVSYLLTGLLVDYLPTYLILSVAGTMLMLIAVSIHRNQVIGLLDPKPEPIIP